MDSTPMFMTLLGLAIALAVFGGASAARLLLHAAAPRKLSDHADGDER
jgi:hypothetical protein